MMDLEGNVRALAFRHLDCMYFSVGEWSRNLIRQTLQHQSFRAPERRLSSRAVNPQAHQRQTHERQQEGGRLGNRDIGLKADCVYRTVRPSHR